MFQIIFYNYFSDNLEEPIVTKFKVTIENDVELTLVKFAKIGKVGIFNCRSNPIARFEVQRK